jgi:nucleoside-diphosphate-sugar epimerase
MGNFLVTGGAGFIGSHLVSALIPDHQVTVFDNYHSGSINNGSRLAQGRRKCQDARNEREKQVRKSFKNF